MKPIRVYVALGSNLGNPIHHIQTAFTQIAQLSHTSLEQQSSLYCGKALGPVQQPDIVNAVITLYTQLSPLELLQQLQQIEQQHNRIRVQRWGPRSLDLDILLYGNEQLTHPQLTLPHPEMERREFVLIPLQEINPNLILPSKATIPQALMKCERLGLIQIVA